MEKVDLHSFTQNLGTLTIRGVVVDGSERNLVGREVDIVVANTLINRKTN